MKYKAGKRSNSDIGVNSNISDIGASRFLCEGTILAESWSKWRRKHAIRKKCSHKGQDKILKFPNGECFQSSKNSKISTADAKKR